MVRLALGINSTTVILPISRRVGYKLIAKLICFSINSPMVIKMAAMMTMTIMLDWSVLLAICIMVSAIPAAKIRGIQLMTLRWFSSGVDRVVIGTVVVVEVVVVVVVRVWKLFEATG